MNPNETEKAIQVVPTGGVPDLMACAMRAEQVLAQVKLIQEVMKAVMQVDVHYGTIPGTQKPTLYKAGAEKLCMTFRLEPRYTILSELRDGDHVTFDVRADMYHIPSGQCLGSGLGSCSTKESRYAYRKGDRKCPACGKEAIAKGNPQFAPKDGEGNARPEFAKGGWYCNKKKDGCNAKFADADPAITSQPNDARVPNPDVSDLRNTVLKMACKRARTEGVLCVTAASDIYTQDMEDLSGSTAGVAAKEPAPPISAETIATLQEPVQELAHRFNYVRERFPDSAAEFEKTFFRTKTGYVDWKVILKPGHSEKMLGWIKSKILPAVVEEYAWDDYAPPAKVQEKVEDDQIPF